MTVDFDSPDASFCYHETAAAELARFDSAAMPGNLADAMRNAVFLLPPPQVLPMTRLITIGSKEEEQEKSA